MRNTNRKSIILILSTLVAGLLLGWVIFGRPGSKTDNKSNSTGASAEAKIWTCSMHPQIRQHEPGDCPICGMDLIPLEAGQGALDPMAISMSPTAMQLAQVETMVVGSERAEKSVRLNGKVQADERQVHTQSSHVPGRIEQLMVNFTGDFVSRGQVIAYVYSPDLVVAQQELLEAKKIKELQPELFNSAKEKLKSWKLTEGQIEQIAASGRPIGQFPVLANTSGYVTKKMVNAGDYVMRGEAIYQISDLSKVWVLFDVYESDMETVKRGASVSYTVSSLPGETFKGQISFVDPVIDPVTRVAKARVEVVNRGFVLKPEMFVSGTVKSNVGSGSHSVTVPKTAVMWTGKRSVVYVMQLTEQGTGFMLREVELGPELGESYVIESGLVTGEEIAVHGTFAIDAAAQLAGKPSMMSPTDVDQPGQGREGHKTEETAKEVTISAEAKNALEPVFDAYFKLTNALAMDNLGAAKQSGKDLSSSLDKINKNIFKGDAHHVWMEQSAQLKAHSKGLVVQSDLKTLREQYMLVAKAMVTMAVSFGPFPATMYVQHCPMANANKGADWLSRVEKIQNPYFGTGMLTCGETKKVMK